MCNQKEKRVCNVGKTSHYITVQFALFTMINLNRKEFSTVTSVVFVDLEAEKIFFIVTIVILVFGRIKKTLTAVVTSTTRIAKNHAMLSFC